MNYIRDFLSRPKRRDISLMTKFYYADEALNSVSAELDSFDGRKDSERCTELVHKLRNCQDRLLSICSSMLEQLVPGSTLSSREFRVKFPDDILHENLSGQLWFGAECLAAGSCILNKETESKNISPLAKAVTRSLENVRVLLREQCRKHTPEYTEKIQENLKIFDRLFSEFEFRYVETMVHVKSVQEYELHQDLVILFSDTLSRALSTGLISQDLIDICDPSLMFAIPRLSIVTGLLITPEGPLNVDKSNSEFPSLFLPFKNLLRKIRELLQSLTSSEVFLLQMLLCQLEEPENIAFKLKNLETSQMIFQDSSSDKNTIVKSIIEALLSVVLDNVLPEESNKEFQSRSLAPISSLSSKKSSFKKNKYINREDLLHRLYVCISGAADQLQSNYAGDFRSILKSVFIMNFSEERKENDQNDQNDQNEIKDEDEENIQESSESDEFFSPSSSIERDKELWFSEEENEFSGNSLEEFLSIQNESPSFFRDESSLMTIVSNENISYLDQEDDDESIEIEIEGLHHVERDNEKIDNESPPSWIPDDKAPTCMGCSNSFSLFKRRHHCRNCGFVFCFRCSSQFVPLPHYGIEKPVRVCNRCFLFYKNVGHSSSKFNFGMVS